MFGGGDKKVKVSALLLEKITQAAEASGVASVDEFIETVLARECDRILTRAGKNEASEADLADLESKLKGLGYLE